MEQLEQVEQLNRELSTLKQTLALKNKEIELLIAYCVEKKESNTSDMLKLIDNIDNILTDQIKMEKLESDLKTSNIQLENIENELNDKTMECNKASEDLINVETELNDVKIELLDKTVECNKVSEELSNVKIVLTDKITECEKLSQHMIGVENELIKKTMECDKLGVDLSSLKKTLSDKDRLLKVRDDELNNIRDSFNYKDEIIESVKKSNNDLKKQLNSKVDECIELNFVVYNKNKEIENYKQPDNYHLLINPLYVGQQLEYEETKEDYIKHINILNAQLCEKDVLIKDYCNLINDIQLFIRDIQEKQNYVPLFTPSRIIDNLMILFNGKMTPLLTTCGNRS